MRVQLLLTSLVIGATIISSIFIVVSENRKGSRNEPTHTPAQADEAKQEEQEQGNAQHPLPSAPLSLHKSIKWVQFCPKNDSDKYVLVSRYEGGMGDRLKGIVGAFFLAIFSGRKLLVTGASIGSQDSLTHPVPGCAWSDWDADEVQRVRQTHPVWDLSVVNVRPVKFHDFDFSAHEHEPVWDVRNNMFFADELLHNPSLPFVTDEHREVARQGKMFHWALRNLLLPSPTMKEHMDRVVSPFVGKGHYFISLHVRTGDSNMSSNTRKRAAKEYRLTHPHEYRMVSEGALPCFAEEALTAWHEVDCKEDYPAGPVFFISSDSARTISILRGLLGENRTFDSSAVDSEIQHFQRGGRQTRTHLDYWILATYSQRMVISVSGFSEIASKHRCVPVSFFVNHPSLERHNDYSRCDVHFVRMRGPGLCVPEADGSALYEFTYLRYV